MPQALSRFLGERRFRAAGRHLAAGRPARAARLLRRAAESGHGPARASLGEAYRTGRGVVRDPSEAAHWLRLAAEGGSVDAQFSLARLLLDGAGGPAGSRTWLQAAGRAPCLSELLFPHGPALHPDAAEAARWLREASGAGHSGAKAQLAWLLTADAAADPDGRKAFGLFASAAAGGVAEAHFGLGRCHELGRGTASDLAAAAAAYRDGAEAGHGPAQLRLGLAFRDGIGVEADGIAARFWLEQAMEGGSAPAAYEWARLLLLERRESGDAGRLAEAAETALRRAVRQDHRPALTLLAALLAGGTILPRDEREAARLYRRAAEGGDVEARFVMGRLLSRGEGVRLDLPAARRWYESAAEGGHALAAFNLAVFCQKGLGGPADDEAAGRWFAVAAETGLVPAQLGLGRHLGRRATDSAGRDAAFHWVERAAAGGSPEARRLLGDMAFDFAVRLCRTGEDGPDFAEACRWYERSAREGHLTAGYNLSVMKLKGLGGPTDRAGARPWLERAAAGGHPEAQATLLRLDRRSPADARQPKQEMPASASS